MNIRKFAAIAALGLCTAGSAWAKDYKVGQIEVDDLWVRASAPGQANGAGYMDIDNDAKTADRLLSVSSDAAERVELHTVQTENGVSKMRQVEGGIALPADTGVKLSPGGYHVMFIKLKAPFTDGATVPATLKFEKAGEVAVQFKVKPASHNPGMSHDHGAMKH
ncbi:copper chaperone PCu(A)C [Achromobacter deleyi]|uniref:copper chaperone PCu(A)C n=1 Tax=Achromobacter deleyi TaxID=1353891 RepID=UPI001490BE85|nr:copper chaperone PCu(A)C [Achromobacter deleyi]QVQ25717.1 copper chaperone PCu(A)C [Achromobacter deleyi]UIP21257.1 copper chaperone PCu(A)C [Achromobacter deleyi]